tara:strand:+ start:8026 stop:9366 length:1341 start_codon:yes stop_codon:yes gene_type:complete
MKANLSQSWKVLIIFLLSALAYYYLGYELERTDFLALVLIFSIPFALYFYLIKNISNSQIKPFLGMAVLFRILFLFSIPSLSDDYFRFIWDGQLMANGINPFDFLPTEVTIDFPNKAMLLTEMNSPNYYSIYPPISQAVFLIGVSLSPNSILGSIVVMRLLILLAEIATILLLPKLLEKLKLSPSKSLIYVLNPLVIIELTGNLHFEAFLIFFMVLAFYMLLVKKEKLMGVAWAFAAAVKLIPLLLLPILLRKLTFKNALISYLLIALTFVGLWFPFYNANFLNHYFNSLNLYFQSFEFNAGIYYFIRWLSSFFIEYNPIQRVGPWFSKIALILILLLLLRKRNQQWNSFFNSLLFSLSVYFALAIVVHPWYLCTLVFLAVFTNFRYPILWSAFAILSYYTYIQANFQESYVLITIEYLAVFSFGSYELWRAKNRKGSNKIETILN